MAPISREKQQSNQQVSAMQSRDRPLQGAASENAAANLQGSAAEKHEEKKERQYELIQDGYFPPTDDVDWASEAMSRNLKDSQQNNKSDDPEVQIIEPGEQVGRGLNAQNNLRGTAAENAQGNLQGAAAQVEGTDVQVPNVEKGGITTHVLHGAAAEAKKGHLMGAAAEAKKGHLMGAAAENVKGNLQGAAAKAHEQKLQREANAQAHPQLNVNDKKIGFDAQGHLVDTSAHGKFEQIIQREGKDGEFVTPRDHAQLPAENEGHEQSQGRAIDSTGNLVGAAAQNGQSADAMGNEQKRNAEEVADESVPLKQAKYDESVLRNPPPDVSAH